MIDYPNPKMSTLCQSVTRDGKTVNIEIYEDGENGWLLEIVDEYGNSTVWDDPFATEQSALDEAMTTINEEGIDSVIGPESGNWLYNQDGYDHRLKQTDKERFPD